MYYSISNGILISGMTGQKMNFEPRLSEALKPRPGQVLHASLKPRVHPIYVLNLLGALGFGMSMSIKMLRSLEGSYAGK